MRQHSTPVVSESRPRPPGARTPAVRIALCLAALVGASAGCAPETGGGAGGAGGSAGGSGGSSATGGRGGRGGAGGGATGGSGGSAAGSGGGAGSGGSGGSGGNSGSTAGSGGSSAGGTGGSTGGSGTGGAAGSGGTTGGSTGGTAGTGGPGTDGGGTSDGSPQPEAGAGCGVVGQACCAGNMCTAGAPMTAPAAGGDGMTVLELKPDGGDPYAQFRMKNLLPIDGPDSGYITDDGMSFLFVLHENGAEETVSSGAQRQRNEVTVNPGNPAIYKAMKGDTLSYVWRFRLEKMNANPTWCDIFQVKQHGPLGVAPYMALEADKANLNVDTEKLGKIRSVPLSSIMNQWINASVTIKFADAGSVNLLLKKDDGTVVMSYTNNNADFWDTTVDFVRPKWGLYRNKRAGAGEAAVRYSGMKIIRGTASSSTPACTCR
jgi:hypothetical protein